jgi:pilus assembly protein CpaB
MLSTVLFAALVAGAASWALYRVLSSRLPVRSQSRSVVVAARKITVGSMLKDSDFASREWYGAVPAGFSTRREDLAGRGVVATIYEGEPIHEARLADRGAGAGLAAIIPKGMRAVAVRVNDVVGVAGFVLPGMRVDVLISGQQQPAGQGTVSKTLLQNVEVLSAGQNMEKDAGGKPVSVQVVNLLVTPEQAERLTLAHNETRIQLVLRNPLDTEFAKTPGAALNRLFQDAPGPLPPARPRPRVIAPVNSAPVPVAAPLPDKLPPPAAVVVEMIQGNKRSQARFELGEEATP